MRIYLFFCLFLSSLSVGAQGILPFNNPDLPVEERVEDLVRRLTLHEKVLVDVRLFIAGSAFGHQTIQLVE